MEDEEDYRANKTESEHLEKKGFGPLDGIDGLDGFDGMEEEEDESEDEQPPNSQNRLINNDPEELIDELRKHVKSDITHSKRGSKITNAD